MTNLSETVPPRRENIATALDASGGEALRGSKSVWRASTLS